MFLVRSLVLLHLGATLLLLSVFLVIMACQRLADLLRQRWTAPEDVAVLHPQETGASVLDWTIDLRTPARADEGGLLQPTS